MPIRKSPNGVRSHPSTAWSRLKVVAINPNRRSQSPGTRTRTHTPVVRKFLRPENRPQTGRKHRLHNSRASIGGQSLKLPLFASVQQQSAEAIRPFEPKSDSRPFGSSVSTSMMTLESARVMSWRVVTRVLGQGQNEALSRFRACSSMFECPTSVRLALPRPTSSR